MHDTLAPTPRSTTLITHQWHYFRLRWVTQSCPVVYDPMDCSPPGSSVHGDSSGKNTGGGCQSLCQGIFPTQGSDQTQVSHSTGRSFANGAAREAWEWRLDGRWLPILDPIPKQILTKDQRKSVWAKQQSNSEQNLAKRMIIIIHFTEKRRVKKLA